MPSPHLRSPLVVIWLAVAVLVAVIGAGVLALVGLAWWIGPIVGVVAATALVWILIAGAMDRILAAMKAEPIGATTDPRYENLVEGLALSTGLSEPDLLVVDDTALNGAAVAWGDRQAVILTVGLLDTCDRIELEGVLAALLARLKNGDAEAATVTTALFGGMASSGVLAPVLRPLASSVVRRWFDEHREIVSDSEAVSVTRYPPGLTSALQRIADGHHEPAATTAATRHLWFAPPRPDSLIPHSPLSWRLDVLSEA